MFSSLFCLREYNLCLPRKEVEEVDSLRDEWIKLMELAEKVFLWHSFKTCFSLQFLLLSKSVFALKKALWASQLQNFMGPVQFI